MKKSSLIVIAALFTLLFVGISLKKYISNKSTSTRWTIAILQTASHPALDAAREGFKQKLSQLLNNDVDFIVYNAQGSVANAHASAQSIQANQSIHGIFAIATPAAQAIAALEKEKPIFIAAVTDPYAAGLMHSTTNVCGSADMINVKEEVALIPQLIPQAKTVAVLFNNAEINASVLAEKMVKEITILGLHPIRIGITNEAELINAIETALHKADVLLTPTDNTVALGISIIAQKALEAGKPLIVSDNLLVEKGALASRGVDYKKSGEQVAEIAKKVLLQNKKPHEIPISFPESDKIVINKKVLTSLDLSIPAHISDKVTLIDK